MIDQIKQKAETIFDEVVKFRQHIHKYPELSFEEKNTSKYIQKILAKYNIPYTTGWCEHGVVALIQGHNPSGECIALRADMDALPILEKNDKHYRSIHEGIMHACGHDVHTASLLGAGIIINEMKHAFSGSIKLIFQPGEEKLPGGASLLIDQGVLENPKPSCIYGLHVHPPLEIGKVGFHPGPYMASADELYLTVKGISGHAALPHDGVDTVLVAAHIITALQQIVSRNANPIIPSVLSFGKINSVGGATNIITDEIHLEGTFRTLDENWRDKAHQKMQFLVSSLAESMGAKAELKILKGYPSLHNHEKLTYQAMEWAESYLGKDMVIELPIRMTAEDFAYYSHHIPACFFRLGTGNAEKGIISPVHTPTFDIDEKALKISIGLTAFLAISSL